MKYGAAGGSSNKLQWHVGGVSKWDAELVADEWHNVAYEIDFSAGSVAFWHSTGSDELKKTAGPFTASTQSNGADFHDGVLRLPGSNDAAGAEDWFFSGVYIEDGELTTKIGDGSAAAAPNTPAQKPSAAPQPSSASPTPTPSAAKPTAPAAVETPAASSPSAAPSSFVTSTVAPTPTPGAGSNTGSGSGSNSGSGSGSASGSGPVLPKEFTIKEFIAWLKAKQGKN
jgi:hypothetical protein